ncbi:MAG: hypothetical protein GY822_04165 [Deltaproteobacteria bacterium]|nr:hypothetical protein [Deltaproteobacteria bacterium]
MNVDVDVDFSVYDVQNGGSFLWSQTRTLSPENGQFHVVLGEQSALMRCAPGTPCT